MSDVTPTNRVASLSEDWLDNAGTVRSNASASVGSFTTWAGYPYNWVYSTPQKLRLTLSEVDVLRAAAKRSKKLKDVLSKFGPHIELVVDFE